MQRPDEELMGAVAEGDLGAFETLVLHHRHRAWNVAYRFLRDAMEAEDVAQEAFIRVLDAAPRYRPTAAFRTWFYRIVVRLCIDRSRKARPVSAADPPEVADRSPDPAESLMSRQMQAALIEALRGLPGRQRAAVILKHYEGLSYLEIAKALDLSPKAVEGLLSRARETLRIRLTGTLEK